MTKTAKFNIGARVIHKHYGYRAVVIDADPFFQASGVVNPQAATRKFANRNPWYRLLVDNSSQITYVEECALQHDPSQLAIDNPNLHDYLDEQQGDYHGITSLH